MAEQVASSRSWTRAKNIEKLNPKKTIYTDGTYVDLMLVEFPDSDRKFGLVVSTGHKAGLILIKLPKEAESKHFAGIDRQWVIDN